MGERLRALARTLGRAWGPVDRHPRGAFASLAGVALIVALLVGVVAWNQSANAVIRMELQRRRDATFHEHPGQFAGVTPVP